ncbi:MAG: DUF4924 family protein [Bacteroidales bacterium]
MIIARELRSKNIAEYIIYMFQLEDLVRAFDADLEKIFQVHIRHFNLKGKELEECKHWYSTLCTMMQEENIMKQGHLQFLKHKITELESLHFQLLNTEEEYEYHNVFENCINDLDIYKQKTGLTHDVEASLTALYTLLLMRIKKMDISKETSEAMNRISKWISLLARRYHEFEKENKQQL